MSLPLILSDHLSLAEFIVTQHRDIDNSLPPELLPQALITAQLFERVRHALNDKPCVVSSGYRCPELNKAIKSTGKDHLVAGAFDFICPGYGSAYDVAAALAPLVDKLNIGQLIYEHTWVHCSSIMVDKAVNRILTARGTGYTVGISK